MLSLQLLFPSSAEETGDGICLEDSDFEPFLDELLGSSNYASCQHLIDSKKFSGESTACDRFEEVELIEIGEDNPLEQIIQALCDSGEWSREKLEQMLREEEGDGSHDPEGKGGNEKGDEKDRPK